MTSVSGWTALILFIASFYLALRLPFINWIFDGLKFQLRWHHWVALSSVTFMFLHLVQVLWLFKGHLKLIIDWSDIGLLSGWLTLAGIVLTLPFAFYPVYIPYRQWRLIHLITAICLVTAIIHTLFLFEPNTVSEWTTIGLVVVLAMIALLFAIVLPAFSFWGEKYIITSVTEIRPKFFLLQLQSHNKNETSQHFHFHPGHFIYLKFSFSPFYGIWHPFTIISKPSAPLIELFIKARGKDTEKLSTISLPTPVRILAPFGTAFWKSDQYQLWIAYGVGVAIFLAAIRSFPSSYKKKIHFICCDTSVDKLFFSKEFNDCMQKHPNFTWETYIGSGIQFIEDFKNKAIDENVNKIRICGHPLFQKNVKAEFISRGFQSKNIELEGLL